MELQTAKHKWSKNGISSSPQRQLMTNDICKGLPFNRSGKGHVKDLKKNPKSRELSHRRQGHIGGLTHEGESDPDLEIGAHQGSCVTGWTQDMAHT